MRPTIWDNALSATASAVAHALLYTMTRTLIDLKKARQKYGMAVRHISDILPRTSAVDSCSVIIIILLLAIFEVSSFICLSTPESDFHRL